MSNLSLPFENEHESAESRIDARDRAGRERAVDPRFNVALEASAGTGKTRVLVERYVNLLRAGVDPENILAITFTRKAASEMRERIMATLKTASARGEIAPARWRELRDRTADVTISTIDAFCLSLLREFPLEADLDPGFSIADETEVPRLVDESLDRALRICRAVARQDEEVCARLCAAWGPARPRRARGAAASPDRRASGVVDVSGQRSRRAERRRREPPRSCGARGRAGVDARGVRSVSGFGPARAALPRAQPRPPEAPGGRGGRDVAGSRRRAGDVHTHARALPDAGRGAAHQVAVCDDEVREPCGLGGPQVRWLSSMQHISAASWATTVAI